MDSHSYRHHRSFGIIQSHYSIRSQRTFIAPYTFRYPTSRLFDLVDRDGGAARTEGEFASNSRGSTNWDTVVLYPVQRSLAVGT
jgi:hypothetical protein